MLERSLWVELEVDAGFVIGDFDGKAVLATNGMSLPIKDLLTTWGGDAEGLFEVVWDIVSFADLEAFASLPRAIELDIFWSMIRWQDSDHQRSILETRKFGNRTAAVSEIVSMRFIYIVSNPELHRYGLKRSQIKCYGKAPNVSRWKSAL